MRDALDHIVRMCNGSATKTRRIARIGRRATEALKGIGYNRASYDEIQPEASVTSIRATIAEKVAEATAPLVEIEAMVVLLEAREWADTFPKTPLANRLEDALHTMHDELREARAALPVADWTDDSTPSLLARGLEYLDGLEQSAHPWPCQKLRGIITTLAARSATTKDA